MSLNYLIPVGAWLWDKYGKTLADSAGDNLKLRWAKFKWKDAAEAYSVKVKKLYGTMQIMGMKEPVPLDDIFTDVFLLDKPTAFGRFEIEQLKQQLVDQDAPPPNAKRIDALSFVTETLRTVSYDSENKKTIREKNRNLFILGKPGAGKTTFLKYIAVKASEREVDKVPIFVGLKQWADSGLPLLTFIEDRFDICSFPAARPFVEELLNSGSAIVLFDGLDEVNQESGQRDAQIRAMNNFIEKYDRTQMLITCRIAASDYAFNPFTYVEIADFTKSQIHKFVSNWFRNDEGNKDKVTGNKFLAAFEKNESGGLRDLGRTPLLLTLLCLAFNETLSFPQRRVEIYEEALDALLKRWDSTRRIERDEIYRTLSLGHKENMLARIAAETFERNEYFLKQSALEQLITDYIKNVPPHETSKATDGESILKAIEAQHGIFVERAHKIYSFSHLTFQEYFTAKYLVVNAREGTLKNLVDNHSTDRRWREVFLLTTSLLPDASQFMGFVRRSVDNLVRPDEKLRGLLSWASRKSASIEGGNWILRLNYLHLAVHYASRSSDLKRSLDYAITYVLNPSHNIEFDLDRTLNDIYYQTRIYNRVSDLPIAISRARNLGLDRLAEDLKQLSLSLRNESFNRSQFADRLLGLMAEHRDLGQVWDLTKAEEARLTEYIKATCSLQDYLKLAFMPPEEKVAILDSLYSPPEEEAFINASLLSNG